MRPRHSTLQLFLDRICPEPTSGCWLWIGHVEKHGYGKFCDYRGVWWAHRASYELFVGTIPAGLQIDHKCRVRCCVNPRHLRVVTRKGNMETATKRLPGDSCHLGHALVGRNLMVTPTTGRRRCRTCHYEGVYRRRGDTAAAQRVLTGGTISGRGTRRAHDSTAKAP